MKKLLVLLTAAILCSCGPTKEEMEANRLAKLNQKYDVGSVVYLKPDSCVGLVLRYFMSFPSGQYYYLIRDCRGDNIELKEKFIYGLKHK